MLLPLVACCFYALLFFHQWGGLNHTKCLENMKDLCLRRSSCCSVSELVDSNEETSDPSVVFFDQEDQYTLGKKSGQRMINRSLYGSLPFAPQIRLYCED